VADKGRPITYDRDELHSLMFDRADGRGVFTTNLKMLSTETGISYYHLTRIVQKFVIDGRLRPLSRGAHRLQNFIVADPAAWS